MNTYHKTTYRVVVLSEGEYRAMSLEQIGYDIGDQGPCAGWVELTKQTTLSPQQMADELSDEGVDVAFFPGLEEELEESKDTDG